MGKRSRANILNSINCASNHCWSRANVDKIGVYVPHYVIANATGAQTEYCEACWEDLDLPSMCNLCYRCTADEALEVGRATYCRPCLDEVMHEQKTPFSDATAEWLNLSYQEMLDPAKKPDCADLEAAISEYQKQLRGRAIAKRGKRAAKHDAAVKYLSGLGVRNPKAVIEEIGTKIVGQSLVQIVNTYVSQTSGTIH